VEQGAQICLAPWTGEFRYALHASVNVQGSMPRKKLAITKAVAAQQSGRMLA
jgi:hypothetical protein